MTASHSTGTFAPAAAYERLLGRSFLSLLVAQFLGATNDAIFRFTVPSALESLFAKKLHALAVALPALCFIVPWILLSPVAGWAADRFEKQRVLVACKAAELFCMLAIVGALMARNPPAICLAAFLMAAQFAVCNPSKFGSIPDLVRPERISAANALLGLTTMVAMIVGYWFAGALYDHTFPKTAATANETDGDLMTWVFITISAAGLIAASMIRRRPAADPTARVSWNFARTMWRDLASLRISRQMVYVVVAYASYWSLGTLAQLTAFAYGSQLMKLSKADTSPLLGLLALGAGLGSVTAGVLSAGIIELGLVPLGGLLFSGAAVALTWTHDSHSATAAALAVLGFGGGLLNVPLYSYIQFRSPPEKRGSVLAANNVVTFSGMLAATLAYYLLLSPDMFERRPVLNPRSAFFATGFVSLPIALIALYHLRVPVARVVVRSFLRCFYKVRVYGRDDLPDGGALLVSNHVTWIDGLLIGITCPKPPRMLAFAPYLEAPIVRWFAKITGVIPIVPGTRAAVESIREAREALRRGEYVCIFAEGCLSRTGHLLQFQPGLLKILRDVDAPVVPIYLDGLWGSIFSYSGGRFFWKWPKMWRYPIGVHYGAPLTGVSDVATVRRAVEMSGIEAAHKRKSATMILTRRFLRECRRSRGRVKVADTTGAELTGGTLLVRTLALKRALEREVVGVDEKFVGVLLPPSAGAVVVNTALAVSRRVAVNLNYTVPSDVMNVCIKQAHIRHVLTSRKVMQKLDLKIDAELVYLEDFKERVGTWDKIVAAFQGYALPVWLLERQLGLLAVSPDDLLTVIFTSGSTGEPKGVMLSYENVGSNVAAIDQIIHLRADDVLAGILPFFHSFGYMATMWTILTLAPKGVYHYSPLEARQIGEMCGKHGATILMTTPTFLRSYIRRCSKEEFAKLDVVVTGAEKLPVELADAFEKQFGVRPVEGYGCTELSPLVSVNVPPSRAPQQDQPVAKPGTVGRPIPGVAAKITDLDTGAELPSEKPGMLWIKGPNVMLGYLHHPEKTAQVVRDGWYQTGDVALIDRDGFIKITGRESRFSKIGGEMVPHIKIEELLTEIVGGDDDQLKLAVTAVPDRRKGERLVVVHTPLDKSPEAVVKQLQQQSGLPNLWIPSAEDFLQVDHIPVLGSGKLDLRALKNLALSRFGEQAAPA